LKNQQEFTIRTNGKEHSVSGDPSVLTLRDALMQTTQSSSSGGKQGGEVGQSQWNKSRFKVEDGGGQTREYSGESDLNKTFTQLGITPGSTIEVLTPSNV
jgi:hypothetical protein